MYGLVIGASEETVYAINKAKRMGLTVLAFDGDRHAVGLNYADESFVVDIRKPENIFSILDEKGIKAEDMVVIPVPIGRYLITSGYVNDHYGLLGPSGITTEICTDKWRFHQTLSAEGLRNINCKLLVEGTYEANAISFPMIAKPRYGAGSRQVISINSDEEWNDFKNNLPYDEDFVLEDEVQGTEYGVDGMVQNGEFGLILLRKKILTPRPYRQCVGYISVNPKQNKKLVERVEIYMKALISSVKMKNGVLHADLIDDGSKTFVIEMSARPSGHRLHDLFTPLVTGVDMIESFINMYFGKCKNILSRESDETYIIRYFDINGKVIRIPDESWIVKKYNIIRYECNLKLEDLEVVKDGHSLMGRGFFVIKGKNEQDVIACANTVLEEFVKNEQ